MKTLLTAHAVSVGGRTGHSQTTDGKLKFELSMPGAPAKSGVTTNPEELFACGYSACFGGALDYVASLKKMSVAGSSVQADVSLNNDNSGFFLAVTLTVHIPGMDMAAAKALVDEAHQICPYSKATRNNVQVTLNVVDAPMAKAG